MSKLIAIVTDKKRGLRFEAREGEFHKGTYTGTCGPTLDDNISCALFRMRCGVFGEICQASAKGTTPLPIYFKEVK